MTLRIETRKRATSVLATLGVALAVVAATTGTALAAPARDAPSFTDRVQAAQGVDSRRSDRANARGDVTLPSDATSFIARVEASMGITPGAATEARPSTPYRYHEPESFTDRIIANEAPSPNGQ